MTHDEKFAGFNKMITEAKAGKVEVLMVHHPEVLGDNYVELVENLNRVSDAGLQLVILPRAERLTAKPTH